MHYRALAACSEFPNDNRELHRGAIWLCLDLTGPAACERPVVEAVTPGPVEFAPEAIVEVPEPLVVIPEPIAVVLEPVVEPTPEPVVEVAAKAEPPTDPTPPVLEADDAGDDIEIVDEIVIEAAVDESIPPPPPPPAEDPFVALVGVLEDVARAAGAPDAAMTTLRTLVGRERIAEDAPADLATLRAQAAGWQAILKGDSEDFSLVGSSSLDEWSSIVVARALGEPARADVLRRELRRRGVAAFGLVIEAA